MTFVSDVLAKLHLMRQQVIEIGALRETIARRDAELAILEHALRYYADTDNHWSGALFVGHVEAGGIPADVAINALDALEETAEPVGEHDPIVGI